jgi:glycosyltransferase EpsD
LGDLKREIDGSAMDDRFDLPGWVTPEDVLDWFTKSDILFMPSLSEGLPVTGVQALAKGLALVVSDIGGFKDLVVPGENGYLIRGDDHDGFVNILRSILQNENLLIQLRKASLVKARQFHVENIVSQYELVFRDVMS